MPKRNSSNQDYTNNADGWDLTGGTTGRKLTVTGADITMTGGGSNTYTFPSSTDTLVGRASTDTLTSKTASLASNTLTNPYKFRVRKTTAQNTTAVTFVKVNFNTEDFDSNGNFDNATNFRYTAPVAGFYQFNACVHVAANPGTYLIIALYKNGNIVNRGGQSNNSAETAVTYSDVVQAAATDYFEIFVLTSNAVALDTTAGQDSFFSGFLVSHT